MMSVVFGRTRIWSHTTKDKVWKCICCYRRHHMLCLMSLLSHVRAASSPGWCHHSSPPCLNGSRLSRRPPSCIYLTSLCWHHTLLQPGPPPPSPSPPPPAPAPPHHRHQGPSPWSRRRRGKGRGEILRSPADLRHRLLVTLAAGGLGPMSKLHRAAPCAC